MRLCNYSGDLSTLKNAVFGRFLLIEEEWTAWTVFLTFLSRGRLLCVSSPPRGSVTENRLFRHLILLFLVDFSKIDSRRDCFAPSESHFESLENRRGNRPGRLVQIWADAAQFGPKICKTQQDCIFMGRSTLIRTKIGPRPAHAKCRCQIIAVLRTNQH